MKNLTDAQIMREIENLPVNEQCYVHSCDQVRLAFQWLDAQKKLKRPNKRPWLEKHVLERWAGRYISWCSVEVAGRLHPEITGNYPCFNIGNRFIYPNKRRQIDIAEAGIHPNYSACAHRAYDNYFSYEA